MVRDQRALGGAAMPDILSQGGGDRERGPWPRRLAAFAVLAVVAAVVVTHLPGHRPAQAHHTQAAGTGNPVSNSGPSWTGLADGPNGITGQTLPWDGSIRLPVRGEQPVWFSPGTGRLTPIGGLPRSMLGYEFTRMTDGWVVQANPATKLGCGSCAGSPLPVYFLRDSAQSAIPVGTADSAAPGSTAGTLWLTSYPQGTNMATTAGTAREVSVTGAALGSQVRLPEGFVIDRSTSRGLLLAPVAHQIGPAVFKLWDPAAPQASRTFSGVIAAGTSEIAWTQCAPRCRVQMLNLETGRHTVAVLPRSSSAASGAFSPDGNFLALEVSSDNGGDGGALATEFVVASVGTGHLTVVPGTWASSDALVGFGWPAASDSLIAELSFTSKVQLALWRPGNTRLTVAVIRPGRNSASDHPALISAWDSSRPHAGSVKGHLMADAKVPKMALRHEFLAFAKQRQRREDRFADKITAFSGSMLFVYVHVVWFTAWIVLNVTVLRFDPFPFGLLTLIVSLEAIFLSTFVLLSQNRESARSDMRSEIDFETNVLSEVWLEALADNLGIDVGRVYAKAQERIEKAKVQQGETGGAKTGSPV
jgi:uncharacterized membrane protein